MAWTPRHADLQHLAGDDRGVALLQSRARGFYLGLGIFRAGFTLQEVWFAGEAEDLEPLRSPEPQPKRMFLQDPEMKENNQTALRPKTSIRCPQHETRKFAVCRNSRNVGTHFVASGLASWWHVSTLLLASPLVRDLPSTH